MSPKLTAEKAKQYSKKSLFADKTWRWSPSPWTLPSGVCEWVEDLSKAAISFYLAIDLLYRKSWKDESVLRNEELLVPWVRSTMTQVNHLGSLSMGVQLKFIP